MKWQIYPIFILSVLTVMCLTAFTGGLAWGSKTLGFDDVWIFLTSRETGIPAARHYTDLVIENRLFRTLGTLLCGAALGTSGALMQGLTRNPLADSGLLGINAGAAALIVSAALVPSWPINPFWPALTGALAVAAFVSMLGLGKGGDAGGLMILAGMAVSVCLYAYVQMVIQLNPQVFDQYRFWASGSFGGIKAVQLAGVLPFWIAGTVLALFCGRYVNLIALDKQTALSLGANVLLIRAAVLLAAATLSAVSVALAGPIAFIGLGAVHIARRLIGSDYRFLIPAAMLNGAALLCGADILARTVVRPSEIATGIMTALLGASLLYVLVMLKRTRI
ncbi:iron ABC transporter permease [Neisseria leonii]|uniref:FecCD family ABC transporter permease n=1 Tax=Neisseria leonii TaxID=2995413 RepID=UPI00237A68C3|nr:iron ABC transporter permease [Neisseria sp. 3986]MDD9325286.1 iron ABC transporter permease [Neisseria sp. 3986]